MSSPNLRSSGHQRGCRTWRTANGFGQDGYGNDSGCSVSGDVQPAAPAPALIEPRDLASGNVQNSGHEVKCLGSSDHPQHWPNSLISRGPLLVELCGLSPNSMPGVVRSGLAVGGSSALGGGAIESDALPHVWLAARYVSHLLCPCSCFNIAGDQPCSGAKRCNIGCCGSKPGFLGQRWYRSQTTVCSCL
jgi:hypothetical protein